MNMGRKRPQSATVDDFEQVRENLLAKRHMMQGWRNDGVSYPSAVIRYSVEQRVSVEIAQMRIVEMEILTGIILERA